METKVATAILMGLKRAEVDFVVSLPSSTLAPVISKIAKDKRFVHVPVANEADVIGVMRGCLVRGQEAGIPVFK